MNFERLSWVDNSPDDTRIGMQGFIQATQTRDDTQARIKTTHHPLRAPKNRDDPLQFQDPAKDLEFGREKGENQISIEIFPSKF